MKIATIAALGAAATMAGCASTLPSAYGPSGEVDAARVAAIDNVARSRGVTVKWVNYPQRRSPAADVAPAPADPAGS